MSVLSEINSLRNYHFKIHGVAERIRQQEWSIDKRTMPHTLLWFILAGSKDLQINDAAHMLKKGDLVILPSDVSFSLSTSGESTDPLRYLTIRCEANAGALDLFKTYSFPFVTPVEEPNTYNTIIDLWRELLSESRNLQEIVFIEKRNEKMKMNHQGHFPPLQWIRFNALVYSLLELLFRQVQGQPTSSTNRVDARVLEACSFIRLKVGQKLKMKDIADHVYMSESHLRLLFRQILCCSPMEYMRRIRIERACELLVTTDYSLKKIAHILGFEDQNQISRAFRQSEGINPRQYRQQWQIL
jgi:AraC family transcriptional regulator of arabinose operon